MSTKIYNAYKIDGSSLDEVINFLFENKSKITSGIERAIIKEIFIEMIVMYDNYCLENETIDNSENNDKNINQIIIGKLWNKDEDKNEEMKEIETSIILYPKSIDYFGQKSYLFQYFGDEKFLSVINNVLGKKIMNYDYYNNTDHPDELTEFEWELRKEHWKNIDIPLFNGMAITFTKEKKYAVYYMNARKKELLNEIFNEVILDVNLEKRIDNYKIEIMNKVAYEHCYQDFIKENKLENENPEKLKDLIFEKGMSIYFDSRNYVRDNLFNEDEINQINEKVDKIKKSLKEHITLEDFNIKISEIKNKNLRIIFLEFFLNGVH